MTAARGGGALALALALAGLGAAWWSTAPRPAAPAGLAAPAPDPSSTRSAVPSAPAAAPAPEKQAEQPAADRRPPGDDAALRARLYVHAKMAVADWPLVASRIEEPGLRAEAEAMVGRLGRLDEPAEDLSRDEYDLTQRLIAHGGWDRTTLRRIQALNSAAAMVIQGG